MDLEQPVAARQPAAQVPRERGLIKSVGRENRNQLRDAVRAADVNTEAGAPSDQEVIAQVMT
jgi:hypothetical protein